MMKTCRNTLGGLLLVSLLLAVPAGAQVPDSAEYEVTFTATWSSTSHPMGFPSNAHFSRLVGGVHDSSVTFWEDGGMASVGIERMAEDGLTIPLSGEVEDAIAAGNAMQVLLGDGIGSPGSTSISFEVSREFPLVTLVTMLAPSPDWFVGVSGLNLFENGNWVNQKVVTLFTYDAGTDSGAVYTSPNQDTVPQEPIRVLDTGAFANGKPVGTYTFTRLTPSTPLLLNDGRFQVEADWRDFDGNRGQALPFQLTDDSGYFYFFNMENVELVIKVLDGCKNNGHFWFFAAGLTNVEVELRVEDTQTSQVNVYSNVIGEAFQPIQDVRAFATCP